jgi:3-deoxy-D-arabino-heptulosonate 7-phosphate (DAHP) synthase class II
MVMTAVRGFWVRLVEVVAIVITFSPALPLLGEKVSQLAEQFAFQASSDLNLISVVWLVTE